MLAEWGSIAKLSIVCIVTLSVGVAPEVNGAFDLTAAAFRGNPTATLSTNVTTGSGTQSNSGDQTLSFNNGGGSQEGTIEGAFWVFGPGASTEQNTTAHPTPPPSIGSILFPQKA